MKDYIIKNKNTNKYYNLITRTWSKYLTIACLITNNNTARELLKELNDSEMITINDNSTLLHYSGVVDMVVSI